MEGRYHISSDGTRLLLAGLEDAGLEDHYFKVIPNLPAFMERERGR